MGKKYKNSITNVGMPHENKKGRYIMYILIFLTS